jgi:hypothetical protein
MNRTCTALLIRLILIAALAFSPIEALAAAGPVAAAIATDSPSSGPSLPTSQKHDVRDDGEGDDDEKEDGDEGDGDDEGKDKDRDDDQDNGNRGDGNGNDKDRRDDDERIDVEAVADYVIEVECEYNEDDDQSSCRFTPREPDGGHKVTHLVAPVEAVCAPVIEGEAELFEPDPVTGISGYTTTGGERELSLDFAGEVDLDDAAIYWVKVKGSVLPAVGPGLGCDQGPLLAPSAPSPTSTTDAQPTAPPTLPTVTPTIQDPTAEPTTELTDSTGSIVVELLVCPIAAVEADYDWFGACEPGAEGVQFRVASDGGGTTTSLRAATDAGGQARFSQLEPGTWVLTQIEDDWCHAKSDGVDAEGKLIVSAGSRTTVWVFACVEADTTPTS